MKISGIAILLFWGVVNGLQAQDSTTVSGKRFYLLVGGTVPLTSTQSHVTSIFGIIKSKGSLDFGVGLYNRDFKDNTAPELTFPENNQPIHEVGELNFSVGKTVSVTKNGFLTFFAGPTFVKYVMPYNLRSTYTGGWKGYRVYEYDTRTYYLPGVSARADVVVMPFRDLSLTKTAKRKLDIGASVGGLVNYHRKLTSWGLNLNLVIGG